MNAFLIWRAGRVTTQPRPVRPAKATGPTGAACSVPPPRIGHPCFLCRMSVSPPTNLVPRPYLSALPRGSSRVPSRLFFFLELEPSRAAAAPSIPVAPRPDSTRQSLPHLVLHLYRSPQVRPSPILVGTDPEPAGRHCRRRLELRCRSRFVVSGRPLFDSSCGKLLLPLLHLFRYSSGLLPCRAGPPTSSSVCYRTSPPWHFLVASSRRPLVG